MLSLSSLWQWSINFYAALSIPVKQQSTNSNLHQFSWSWFAFFKASYYMGLITMFATLNACNFTNEIFKQVCILHSSTHKAELLLVCYACAAQSVERRRPSCDICTQHVTINHHNGLKALPLLHIKKQSRPTNKDGSLTLLTFQRFGFFAIWWQSFLCTYLFDSVCVSCLTCPSRSYLY